MSMTMVLFGALENAVRAEHCLLDFRAIGHHRDHEVAPAGHVFRRGTFFAPTATTSFIPSGTMS
jgi:hypothetical protein